MEVGVFVYAVYVKSEDCFVSAVDYDGVVLSSDDDEALKFSSAEMAARFILILHDVAEEEVFYSIYKF